MDEMRDNNIRHLDQCGTGQDSTNVSFFPFCFTPFPSEARVIILPLTISSKAILPGNC